MISFNYETSFCLGNENQLSHWIAAVIKEENRELEEVNFIFCDDDYLHNLNIEFLSHDTLTDVISFDYSVGNVIAGDVYISVERVADNAKDFGVTLDNELHRVMVHGVLHYCGYKDKTELDTKVMRDKENYHLLQLGTS